MPMWVTNELISAGMYSDRFGLPAMWAGSVILVGLQTHIRLSKRYKSLLISILIALSIGAHFRISNDYRWDWTQQKRFFWQLFWRAPAIEPGTAIFADGTIFTYVGDYPLSFAINSAYSQPTLQNKLPYWFFELDRGFHQESWPPVPSAQAGVPRCGRERVRRFQAGTVRPVGFVKYRPAVPPGHTSRIARRGRPKHNSAKAL